MKNCQLIIIGCSYGGIKALKEIFSGLPQEFTVPIVIVSHMPEGGEYKWFKSFASQKNLVIKEAVEREKMQAGTIYFAPADYHLLIDEGGYLAFDAGDKVNYSRPSIDVSFMNVAHIYGNTCVGILCTGASSDGARGLKKIHEMGGLTFVQDPKSAEVSTMPQAALDLFQPTFVKPLNEIIAELNSVLAGI